MSDETSKQYLQRHKLHILFEHMAYKVLSERPEDPVRAMFDYLGTKIGVDTKNIKSQPAKKPEKQIVFLFGGPGSGKGTQCERLGKDGLVTYVSTGDLLRAEQEKDTDEARLIKECTAAGRLVSKQTVLAVLKKWVDAQPAGSKLVLDGFPREMSQALSFETDIQPCDFALYFDCPDDILEQRLLRRGETSGRSDDNADTIKHRLTVFHAETQPTIEYYKALGKLHTVNADDDIATIYDNLKKLFKSENEVEEL